MDGEPMEVWELRQRPGDDTGKMLDRLIASAIAELDPIESADARAAREIPNHLAETVSC